MIFNTPDNWEELQNKVCAILNQVGFEAETSKIITTPRGTVELDVYAIDPLSIDKITYGIECKNWINNVPQTVIHAFTRVMQETGANIGYIISKNGFQRGAYEYTAYTNIKILTFQEFQSKYFRRWFETYFCTILDENSASFIQYTEPINSRRERFVTQLSAEMQVQFKALKQKYFILSEILVSLTAQSSKKIRVFSLAETKELLPIEEFKEYLESQTGITFLSTCYFALLDELLLLINSITIQFNDIFGQNIFSY